MQGPMRELRLRHTESSGVCPKLQSRPGRGGHPWQRSGLSQPGSPSHFPVGHPAGRGVPTRSAPAPRDPPGKELPRAGQRGSEGVS